MLTRGSRPALHGLFRQDIENILWPKRVRKGGNHKVAGSPSDRQFIGDKIGHNAQVAQGDRRQSERERVRTLPAGTGHRTASDSIRRYAHKTKKKFFFGKNVFFQLGGGK